MRPAGAMEPHAGDATRAQTFFDRSGIDLGQLLADGDRLVDRKSGSLVELATGLEAARGALVRNQPVEVLALLDESWESAQHTEQGWYLRGSALAALGLPGEALRVSDDALKRRPASIALRFLGSLARLLVGDNAGARALLQEALADAPDDTLLLAHHAVVTSRSGHNDAAMQLLQRASLANPDHPAVQYARAWMSADRARSSRAISRETGVVSDAEEWNLWHQVEDAAPTDGTHGSVRPASDSLEDTFRRLGNMMRSTGAPSEVSSRSRMLMRSLAGVGTAAMANSAERTHAARSLLSLIAIVWTTGHSVEQVDPGEAHGTHAMVKPILVALRDGNHADARQLLVRNEAGIPPSTRALLRALLDNDEPRRSERISGANAVMSGAVHEIRTDRAQQDAGRGVIGPVRLGLALIEESDLASAAAATSFDTTVADPAVIDSVARTTVEQVAIGWNPLAEEQRRSSSRTARMAAVICVLAAIGAAAFAKPVAALALAGGASWLAMRRSHRLDLTAEYSTADHQTSESR